jgi:hypothetical protein
MPTISFQLAPTRNKTTINKEFKPFLEFYIKGGNAILYESRSGYAELQMMRKGKIEHKKLHRLILEESGYDLSNKVIDHINRNRLDNTLDNLRIVSNQQNCWNTSKLSSNTTGYYGVSRDSKSGKFRPCIANPITGKTFKLGYYNSAKDAAKVYDLVAKSFRGENCHNNGFEPEEGLEEIIIRNYDSPKKANSLIQRINEFILEARSYSIEMGYLTMEGSLL